MKRIGRRGAILLLITAVVLVSMVLAFPGLSGSVERHESIRAQVEPLQESEGRFRELVIGLRHGITSNYDQANSLLARIHAAQITLETEVGGVEGLDGLFRAYRQAALGREGRWEDFKRHNSVVRNSLRYFQTDLPVLVRGLRRFGGEDVAHERLATLNTALFLQALGSTGDKHDEIVASLAFIRPRMSVYPDSVRAEFQLMERHVGVILKHAPALAKDMAALAHGEPRGRLERFAEANRALLLEEQRIASWYQRGLLAGVVLLLLGLALIAMRYLDSVRRLGEQGGFLKSVTDNAGVGVLAMDSKDRVIFANPWMERLLGKKPGELIGMSPHGEGLHVTSEGRPLRADECEITKASANGRTLHGVQYMRHADGRLLPMEFSAAPFESSEGRGTVTVMQDISQRIVEEQNLRLAGTVFDSSQQGILITDAQGAILRVNPAYCHITGYEADELIGHNPRILKSDLHDKDFYSQIWAQLILNGRWQGELMNRRKNGERYIQWTSIDAVRAEQGDLLYVGIVSDISELVYARERLAHLAYYDTLTSLPNRVLFQDRLTQVLAQARRQKEHFALILADLDNFKTVNDTLGHAAGDGLLVEVAKRLKAAVREADTVARIGGDEFALILMRIHAPEDAAMVAANVVDCLAKPYNIDGLDIAGGASLGVTFWPDDGGDPETLLKNADVAMYRAKARGRNNFQFFTNDMADSVVEAMRIENGLRHALDAGELAMHYQPQVTRHGRAVAAEALMRWHSRELGWVPPSRFIPVAEHTGLIAALGDFALFEACRQCRAWRETLMPDFRVAVNLSTAQFRHEGLVERVAAILDEFNLPGSALELEITESVVMEDVTRGQTVLKGLKRLGCKLAIDDFGTGYSSLAYLNRFSVDVLKIDKTFIEGLADQSSDTTVAQAIFSLARSLNLDVVAEGIETAGQLDALRYIAGDREYLAQGYFYSRPVPAEEFETAFPAFRQLRLVSDKG